MNTKLTSLGACIILASHLMAQAPPSSGSGNSNSDFWSRSGNNQTTGGNIFGTRWNSPIYTWTGGTAASNYRMKLNATFTGTANQYSINSYGWTQGVNTSGYLLLGNNNNSMASGNGIYSQMGAFSLLHLNGEGSTFQELGYRPWMKTGVTFTGNRDLSYFGLRKLSTTVSEEDLTETVLLWSDNPDGIEGPDKMVFRFSGYGGSDGASVSSNRLSNTDLDALHVAEFTNLGLFGLGNTFGTDATGMSAALYNSPQSLLHMSYDWRTGSTYSKFGFGQITYRRDGTTTTGTGETENDGLRWGIDNALLSQGGTQHLNAYLRWQENSSFIVQSDWDNAAGGVANGERIRFTSVGSLVNTQGSAYGGLTSPTNTTRVAISHNGATPITRPLSLLHLGYNTTGGGTADGWRGWMDIGTFLSNGTDHMYLGLKNQGSSDRQDAIIGWGDNQTTNGPDNMRFIFTSASSGTAPANSNEGLEGVRMTPTTTTGVFTGIGGDPTSNQYGPLGTSANPTATLEVNSWGATNAAGGSSGLRFTNLKSSSPTITNPGSGILSVNANGDVVYVNAPTGGGGIGNYCGTALNPLTGDYQIPMNDKNVYFENNNTLGKNHLGIGYNCNDNLNAKLSVKQWHPTNPNINTIAISGINSDATSVISTTYTGVEGIANGNQYFDKVTNRGGYFSAINSPDVRGVVVDMPSSSLNTSRTIGGEFNVYTDANSNSGISIVTSGVTNGVNYGVQSTSLNSNTQNIAG